MSQFRFANLEWLNAVWGVVVLAAILVALELRGGSLLERLISPLMQDRLVNKATTARRIAAVLLFCTALLTLVLALMRPQWGSSVQIQSRVDAQIMICLDVSKSMLADDVVPNRLERAKAEIDSLLSLMGDGQQLGLMAFAGKSSVLCPMTTDFGFLRLILNEATPETVGLGGTRIGEAILKAVDGFRDAGDVNRLILLITDGEDHDSFPMDAAKAAREKGVRVVSIGFGDELGSKIEVTDPKTGARTFVKDRTGAEVVSRLDGETLRDIALETQGAYIPAGTGALDLQSIYDSHIATLLKGTEAAEETIVRNEAYQWCVLAALCLLVAALALPTFFVNDMDTQKMLATGARATIFLFLIFTAQTVDAQSQAANEPTKNKSAAVELPTATVEKSSEAPAAAAGTPREIYNQAIAFVSSNPDRAESLLNESRRSAGVDGELRFRTLYNLGWVEVNRADALLQSQPEEALKHLELSASRFREAIRVRPDDADSRYNLEILSRRILELTDQIAKKNPQEIVKRLDDLIARIREHQASLQTLVSRVVPSETNIEQHRDMFRQLGVEQRQIISDMEKLVADARRELDAGDASDQAKTDEAAVKLAQFSSMTAYLDSSLQWLNKSRSFVRRLQSERAFVRWAAGLTDAKRARDQLRSPIELLSILLGDAAAHASQVELMLPPASGGTEPIPDSTKPTWLTAEYLLVGQHALRDRTAELRKVLEAGVDQAAEEAQPDAANANADENLLANIREALPFISTAEAKFDGASKSIEAEQWQDTSSQQSDAIRALTEAAEFFYDMRRLIEAMVLEEQAVNTELQELSKTEVLASESSPAIIEAQEKNLRRSARLKQMFAAELATLHAEPEPAEPAVGTQGPVDPTAPSQEEEARKLEIERLGLAEQLLAAATTGMQGVVAGLTASGSVAASDNSNLEHSGPEQPATNTPSEDPGANQNQGGNENASTSNLPVDHAATALRNLEELRRLFFTIVEHLRETAQSQAELNDNSTQLLGQKDQQTPGRIGPLQMRQENLQKTSQAIADALQQQATESPEATSTQDSQPPAEAAQAQADREKLAQASELVKAASQAMASASNLLQKFSDGLVQPAAQTQAPAPPDTPPSTSPPQPDADLHSASQEQQTALQKLAEALALLDEPPPENQDSGQNQQQPQQQEQSDPQESSQPPQNMNAEQMLQAIREREANRRQEKKPSNTMSSGTVEKDW